MTYTGPCWYCEQRISVKTTPLRAGKAYLCCWSCFQAWRSLHDELNTAEKKNGAKRKKI